MKLKVAIQMDHVSTIDIDGDSTFVLGLEAERRGYEVWHYTPPDLIFRDRKVLARAQPMKLRREKGNHFTLGAPEMLDLSKVDVVLLRQDPPFDMAYITTTHLLEHVHPKTLVVNDPASVRNAPEKLYVTHFDGVMPPTLITQKMLNELDIKNMEELGAKLPAFAHADVAVPAWMPLPKR